jgi:hypothetical protein
MTSVWLTCCGASGYRSETQKEWAKVLLKISYRLRAHQVAEYDRTFAERTLPLIREHGLRFWGIWRTIVGDAQEYLELWEFDSLAEFDERWRKLMADARLQEIFVVTGPMVEDEKLSLFEPALLKVSRTKRSGPNPSSRSAPSSGI